MAQPVRWGVLGTGWIAGQFVGDLLATGHTVAAVGSRSQESADEFAGRFGITTAHGSYEELAADPAIDAIYIATPHPFHYDNAMLVLAAGKHALVEKSFTVNAREARGIVELAAERNLVVLEAMWTRWLPHMVRIREIIAAGTLGDVRTLLADHTQLLPSDPGHRILDPRLGGGALLDLGIYSLTWVFQTLYHIQPEAEKEAPKVFAAINKYHTGADESTSMILQFPKHKTMGIGLTSMRLGTDPDGKNSGGPAIKIQGSKGEIQVMGPAYCPLQYKVIKKDGGGAVDVIDCPIPQDPAHGWGHGMFWEADECARCLRDGKLESSTMPWSESVVIMEVMEETLKQGGVTYPHLITTDVYDPESPLNRGR